jgi:hypothetical protein
MDITYNNPNQFSEGGDRFLIGRIRVWPASENIRKYIKHPLGNIAFRATVLESVEWPFDQFTKRRIKDKTVYTQAPVDLQDNAAPAGEEPPKSEPVSDG